MMVFKLFINMTYDIISYLNSFVGEAIAEAISELQIPVLDIASDYRKLAALIKEKVQLKAQPLGIEIVETTIENISLPPEVEKMIDEQSGIGLASKDMSTFMSFIGVQLVNWQVSIICMDSK